MTLPVHFFMAEFVLPFFTKIHIWCNKLVAFPNWLRFVKLKLLLFYTARINAAHTFNSPARNPPENSPNLGMGILSSEPSRLGDEIRGCSSIHFLSFHIGLVPILHLGGVLKYMHQFLKHHERRVGRSA